MATYDVNGNPVSFEEGKRYKILEYNVGNFSEGGTSGYTGNDLQGYIGQWAKFLGGADICLLTESRKHIDSSNSTLANSGLYSKLYDNVLEYNPSETWGAVLLTNADQSEERSKTFTNQSSAESKYVGALVNLNGVDVYVVSVHFNHGTEAASTRALQMQELISDISRYENVIIGGDFNTADLSELETLENAGFTFANGGVFGENLSFSQASPTYPLDNVGVKGNLKIKSFNLLNDIALSDHIPTITEILVG